MTLASALRLSLVGALSLAGQVEDPGEGILSGRVLNSVTGQPVGSVDLALAPAGSVARQSTTADAQGNFRFDRVKFGRYTLQARKAGFAPISYGAAAIGNPGRVLTMASDRGISGLDFRLIPLAAIQGKVINRNGDPVPGVTIACGFVDSYGAPPTMEPLRNLTDDRGEFRMSDMPPGRYYVQALPSQPMRPAKGGVGAELPAFYPSAGKFSEAQPIVLTPGQEASGIKITLREAPVFHVRGKVTGAVANVDLSGLDLLLLPKNEEGGPLFGKSYAQVISRRVGGSSAVRPDGTFDLGGLEQGLYELVAVAQGGQQCLGRVTLNVADRDVAGVALQLGAFVQVSFRIQPDREVNDASCNLTAYPLEGDLAMLTIVGKTGSDGVFAYDHAIAAKYALAARCKPEGWVVKSARLEGGAGVQDVFDEGLNLSGILNNAVVNLVLSKDAGIVVATVSEDGAPAQGRWVTMIPDPPAPGKVLHEMSGWSDEEGRLILKSAAPGDYRVYAWREASLATSSVNLPFLKRFEAQSSKVTVRAGEQVRVETRTVQP
jgi:hypothetical protein